MNGEIIFSGSTLEEVAKAFAEIVSRNYISHLDYWQATAMDDRQEYEQWEQKKEREPEILRENAFNKILKIMQKPELNRMFFKKYRFFRSKNVIAITKFSGFYKDLLPGNDIEHAFAVNVEYLIDIENLNIREEIYPQRIKL